MQHFAYCIKHVTSLRMPSQKHVETYSYPITNILVRSLLVCDLHRGHSSGPRMGRKGQRNSISETLRRLFPSRFIPLRNHFNSNLAQLHFLLYPGLRHHITGRVYRILTSSLPVIRRHLLKGKRAVELGRGALFKELNAKRKSVREGISHGGLGKLSRGGGGFHRVKVDATSSKRKSYRVPPKLPNWTMQGNDGQVDGSTGGKWEGFRRSVGGYLYGTGQAVTEGRGGRRQKIAEYVRAANEIRQAYSGSATGSRGSKWGAAYDESRYEPASNQELMAYVANGKEEIVLFPTYGRRRIVGQKLDNSLEGTHDPAGSVDEGYREEDMLADVDIRGWIYTPHTALPPSRKNRVVMAMISKLCGLPPLASSAPGVPEVQDNQPGTPSEHEAAEMLAMHPPNAGNSYSTFGGAASRLPWIGSKLSAQPNTPAQQATPSLSRAEIEQMHNAMQARLSPFLTTPSLHMPLTVFLYNERDAASTSLRTDNLGHFAIRKPVHFFPTHVRVLAGETLCAEEEIRYIDPEQGISLISDIDDTIKISGIGMGIREMFRNVFTREMSTMPVPGVSEWFNSLAAPPLNVQVHYLSNSPWQLYPFLKELLINHMKLPRGTWHLKKYSGFVQGIFEPVIERKKESLEGLMKDFPGRKWILVGDGGEGDLEVYTDVVKRWPGKVIAVYIRDVSGIGEKVVGSASGVGGEHDFFDGNIESHYGPHKNHMDSSVNLGPPARRLTDSFAELHMQSSESLNATLKPTSRGPARARKQPPPVPEKPRQLRSNNSSQPQFEEDLIDLEPPGKRDSLTKDPIAALYDGHDYGAPSPPQAPPLRRATTSVTNISLPNRPYEFNSNPSTVSLSIAESGQPKVLDKKAELWKKRWEYADQVLAEQGIILRSWKVGQDVHEECVALTKAYLGL